MIPGEGSTDEGGNTALDSRRGWRHGWWRALFGLVATVSGWHLMIFVMIKLGAQDELPPREFSMSTFALTWLLAAVGMTVLELWSGGANRADPPGSRRTPRWLVVAPSAAFVCWSATCFAGYFAAPHGELGLLWADALAAGTFTLTSIVRRVVEQYEVRGNPEPA